MSPFVRPAAIQHGDRWMARSVFLILLGLYTAVFTGQTDNPDAEVEFQTTRSLVEDGRLALGDSPEAQAIIAEGHAVRPGGPAREGEHFSWFGVGQALVGVPFYAAGALVSNLLPEYEERHRLTYRYGVQRTDYFEHLFVGWRNPLLTALTAWLLVISARRLGIGRRNAWLTGISYGLCTFALGQARSTLSDVQATFFLFLAFHQLLKVRESFRRFGRPSGFDLALLGSALGMAFLTRVAVAPAIPVLLLVTAVALHVGRRRLHNPGSFLVDLAWVVVPAAACFALFARLNQVRFGDPDSLNLIELLDSGYSGGVEAAAFFSFPPYLGLAGLLVSPGRGLVWLAPGLLLLPFGLSRAWSRGGRLWPAVVVCVTVALFLPLIGWPGWWGERPGDRATSCPPCRSSGSGWGWPSRASSWRRSAWSPAPSWSSG